MKKWLLLSLIGILVLVGAGLLLFRRDSTCKIPYWISDIKMGNPICLTMKNPQGQTATFIGPPAEMWTLVRLLDYEEGKLMVTDIDPFLKFKSKHPVPCTKPTLLVKKVPVYITKKVPVYITKKVPVYVVKKVYVKQPSSKVHHKRAVHRNKYVKPKLPCQQSPKTCE